MLIRTEYLTLDQLKNRQRRQYQDTLGIAVFAATASGLQMPDLQMPELPIAVVPTPPLGTASAVAEIWRAPGSLQSGQSGPIHYRTNKQMLFGCLALAESVIATDESGYTPLEHVTKHAYAEIFRCIETTGCPHLLRVWNYLPEINRETSGSERYRQFNAARQRAFLASQRSVTGNVPAASALGLSAGNVLTIYFLASRLAGANLENPRQIAAYNYPPQYGAFSPTFSRATLVQAAPQPLLLVSGTASIVGHSTVHAGDVVEQTREAMINIGALASVANRESGAAHFVPERLIYKVYLRHAADLLPVLQELRGTLGTAVPVLFLRAEVCREPLLVEIEAVSAAPLTAED